MESFSRKVFQGSFKGCFSWHFRWKVCLDIFLENFIKKCPISYLKKKSKKFFGNASRILSKILKKKKLKNLRKGSESLTGKFYQEVFFFSKKFFFQKVFPESFFRKVFFRKVFENFFLAKIFFLLFEVIFGHF